MVRALLLAASCILFGCEPKLVVGERDDAGAGGAGGGDGSGGSAGSAGSGGATDSGGSGGATDSGGAPDAGAAGAQCSDNGNSHLTTDPVTIPWSTGFENGFCDFAEAGGRCIGMGIRRTVTSPTRPSGQLVAEFSVTTGDAGNQARCLREGAFPREAWYGAWYYIEATATVDNDNPDSLWNLLHFQGGDASTKGLWDVSLVNGTDGSLHFVVFDFLDGTVKKPVMNPPPPVPIGSWFHIQFFYKRRADATGEIDLYQDDTLVVQAKNLITDDSSWSQWYVGNIARALMPPNSTLYVDDVTIDTAKQ